MLVQISDGIYTAIPASTALKKKVSSALKLRWAQLIKKVYEADPMLCPRCEGSMRIIAFLDQPEVLEKIFAHQGLWPSVSHAPPRSAVA